MLVGLSQDELLSRSYWDLIHPADHGAVAAQHEDAAPRRPERDPVPLPRSCAPTAAGAGSSPRARSTRDAGLIFSVVRDITGREDVELERLATLFDHAPIGMALMAPGGALRRGQHAAGGMLGRTEAELLERTIFDLVDDEDSRGTLALAVGARSRPAFQIETRLRRARRPAGHRALQRDAPCTNAREEPVHYVCQVLDITERAEAQARLAANEAKLAEAQQIARLGLAGSGRSRPTA